MKQSFTEKGSAISIFFPTFTMMKYFRLYFCCICCIMFFAVKMSIEIFFLKVSKVTFFTINLFDVFLCNICCILHRIIQQYFTSIVFAINSKIVQKSYEKKIVCASCDYFTSRKSKYSRHLLTAKYLNRVTGINRRFY